MADHFDFRIAGLTLRPADPNAALARLDAVYTEFGRRLDEYQACGTNVVLCRAGCSHCCRSGGFFAMTLAEALRLNLTFQRMAEAARSETLARATALLAEQGRQFAQVSGPPDQPGSREEPLFSARVARVTRGHPACPLLRDDLCSIYVDRPFLCRAYGYATDAYAVQSANTTVFRSLCILYEGVQLNDYVRARELRAALAAISRTLAGGREVGRFTLPEAILATQS